MARTIRLSIVAVWLVLLGLLLRERWSTTPAPPVAVTPAAIVPADEWLNVYHQEHKIGYVHHRSAPAEGGGFVVEEHSLLRLVVMDTPQTVRTIVSGRTDADYALQQFSFELSSGVGTLNVRGTVTGDALDLTLATGAEHSTQRLALSAPVYLPATLRNFVAAGELRAGRTLQVSVFDPSAMKNAPVQVTVEQREPVPNGSPGQVAWRVREEFRGIQTTAWIDDAGTVLREQGPMGLVLVRTDARDALHGSWSSDTALDLVRTVAIPVVGTIDTPRELRELRLRLRGIDLDQVPSDARQQRGGEIWTIRREDLAAAASYTLPDVASEHRAELAATALLQVEHPRVQSAAAEALAGEHDALAAVHRLLAWIAGYMKQAPTASIPNALQVLADRQGDCNEHAVLFAALARAAGLPARVVAGVVYLDGAFYYHAWNEVWLGHWVSVDPVFNQFPADPTHLKFVQGGPEEEFAILQVIGRVHIDVLGSR
ncbi:MAG: transglutaminase domain-containing protein [Deltaproteobacteria bacterium]|nr:transglutaminase domain-containing protein [Deltaproteobacteria bacterium]